MNQVLELEQAILTRAEQLAGQYAEQAQRTRDTILREANERLRQREQYEETQARALGDRNYRQRVQAAEIKLQSQLDRMRWNLVRRVEDRLAERMEHFISNHPQEYLDYLKGLLLTAGEQFESEAITVRCNSEDHARLKTQWDAIPTAFTGKTLTLDAKPIQTLSGLLLISADQRIRVDNTFEGRMARLRPRLQQVILERLLPASAESGHLFTG